MLLNSLDDESVWDNIVISNSNDVIALPSTIATIQSLSDVVNEDTWKHILNEEERVKLAKLLPLNEELTEHVSGNSTAIKEIFNGTLNGEFSRLISSIQKGEFTATAKSNREELYSINKLRNSRHAFNITQVNVCIGL